MQEPAEAALGHGLISILKHAPCSASNGRSGHRHLIASSLRFSGIQPLTFWLPPSQLSCAVVQTSKAKFPAVNGGLSVGVTLPSQASKVVDAVSELLLASGYRLAVFIHSHVGESEASGEPASSRASAMPGYGEVVLYRSLAVMHLDVEHHRHRHLACPGSATCILRIADNNVLSSMLKKNVLCLRMPISFHRVDHSGLEHLPSRDRLYSLSARGLRPLLSIKQCPAAVDVGTLENVCGANVDIGMVEFCTCISGDALAVLKLVLLCLLAKRGYEAARLRKEGFACTSLRMVWKISAGKGMVVPVSVLVDLGTS
ncbi:hypothetical protein EK21DRAFT_93693 [Setomelanomma holmii]|uniref:Uncharacterized protein n=1 Tax=Setomelanomma holmii TaxID=210430 RepID=A0A9P4GZF0_9PLEO|nr:hypothetical protein EK21DRAFT_93693 [Setomelanomma holmii]